MIIGKFSYNKKDDTYLGDILSLSFGMHNVALVPNAKAADKQPHYRVTAPTDAGHVELGSAWKKESERGQSYLSVELDGPLLSRPCNVAMFLEKDGVHASLVWTRPKKKAEAA